MVKVIMGLKGHGKTKQLIELVNRASEEEHGNVVRKLRYNSHIPGRPFQACGHRVPQRGRGVP